MDYIWDADITDLQLMLTYNKEICLRVFDNYRNYKLVIPVKD